MRAHPGGRLGAQPDCAGVRRGPGNAQSLLGDCSFVMANAATHLGCLCRVLGVPRRGVRCDFTWSVCTLVAGRAGELSQKKICET